MKKSCYKCLRLLPYEDFCRGKNFCKLCRSISEYGATYKEYLVVLEYQNYSCAICKSKDRRLEMDHSPTTNEWRGLVCSDCNRGVSAVERARMSPDAIHAYLENCPTKALEIKCLAKTDIINKRNRYLKSKENSRYRTALFREFT